MGFRKRDMALVRDAMQARMISPAMTVEMPSAGEDGDKTNAAVMLTARGESEIARGIGVRAMGGAEVRDFPVELTIGTAIVHWVNELSAV